MASIPTAPIERVLKSDILMITVVGDVLEYLAGGMSEDQILAEFPQLKRDDIRACLAYAAERERRTLTTPAA